MKLSLEPNETAIDTWAINYIAPDSKASMGKLTVTNRRLLFLPQHEADSLSLSVYNKNGLIVLDKSAIKSVAAQKSFLAKKVVVTMSDGSVHVFNYGIMNIDRILAAVQAN